MGKLIDPDRTRRARQARDERAAAILAAAHQTFVRFPYAEATMERIGRQAGVKQGQATLAYRSREELFLAVVIAQLGAWYDALASELGAGAGELSAEETAGRVARGLAARPDLTRLLGSLHTALELHEDGLEVHRFYRWQRERLLALAETVAGRVPGADRWDAFDALYRAQLTAAAVHPVSRPVGNLAVDLMAEDHQVFALDLEDEVERVVLHTLSGPKGR
ncbi:MAG: TetR family transcriptional regulator [Thermoanaerobaculales bacterium]|jgi:AcrR family transcriptional regulator|nr:TetR family transcriptional regulator [Thermoanaerobaculales bacterium]